MTGESQWLPEPPKHRDHYLRGYYRAIAKDRASWLEGNPVEHVYLYFDGKYSVLRPGESKGSQIDEFSHWKGPMAEDALPPEVEAMLEADE